MMRRIPLLLISLIIISGLFSCAASGTAKTDKVDRSRIIKEEDRPAETEVEEQAAEDEEVNTEGDTVQEEPEEKSHEIAPLTPWAIYRFVFDYAEDGWMPVHRDGVPLLLFYDIDENGYNDVFALYVDRENPEDTEYTVVSDFSRLYDYEVEPFTVQLQLFFQREGTLRAGYSVDLGKKMVIDDMKKFLISETMKTPFSFSINFQNTEGTERTWIFCKKNKYKKLSLRETFAAFIDVKDINTDGLMDILHFEKSFEEGMGYESYITWYNWNGTTYVPYDITNVLRNLHEFLDITKEYLQNQKWRELLQFGLPPRQLDSLKKKKVSEKDIMQALFIPSYQENSTDTPSLVELSIQNIIFPEILENPFQQDKNGHYMFPLRVRVIAEKGEYLYISRIGMKDNPFQPQQFYFITMNQNVYY